MRITIVQGAFFPVPPLLGGAVEKIWAALGTEFARRGHEVTHVSRSYGTLPAQERVSCVNHRRVAGYAAPRSLGLLKWYDLIYSLRVRAVLPPADILVTHTFWLPLLIRRRPPGKLYVHAARYPKGQMRFYAHAARIQTVSQPIAEAIKVEVPRLATKVRAIPNPLPEGAWAERPSPVARVPHELLYVGRLHPEKGVHLLLAALAHLSELNYRLRIVGSAEAQHGGGGEDYLRELRALAAPFGERVEFVGPIFDSERLADCYRKSAIFIYPSLAERGETFGLAPLEAMSFGCAAIVSALACFRDFLQPGENGVVFDHRAAEPSGALAMEIRALLETPERVRALGEAGRKRARDFQLEPIATLYLEDFASLLSA